MRIKMPAVRIAQADTDPTQSTGGADQVDLLTCGQCQRVFLLSDICRFVQHKVTGCGKDTLLANCNSGGAGTGDDAPALDNGLSAASKAKSSSHQHRHHRSQSPAGADEPGAAHHHHRRPPLSSTPKRTSDRNNGDDAASSDDEKSAARRIKQGSESSDDLGYKKSNNRSASSCVDAESNTTNTEPSSFVCCTCKARFSSSWKLLQHAQAAHSMKIYTDGTPSPVSQSKNNSSCSSLGSSGCSSGASTSLPTALSALPLALSMPSRLSGLHPPPPPHPPPSTHPPHSSAGNGPLPPPPPPSMVVDTSPMSMPLHNPFGVGGLLRMPMGEPPQRPSPFPGTSSIGNPSPLFGRSSSHQEHQYRMEQIMSEQFRLNQQQHGLGFAVAVAAANAMPTSPFPGLAAAAAANDRNNPRHPAPTLPALNLDPQMDFYSQRLRQLAGTTSPGAATAPSSSPSPRKMTPPFSSPNNNNNNNNSNNSNNVNNNSSTTAVSTTQSSNGAGGGNTTAVAATIAVTAGLNNNNNNNNNVSNNNSVDSPSEQDRVGDASGRSTLDLSSGNNASGKEKPVDAIDLQKQHIGAAEEEKTRECEYCGKKFRFLSNLIVHRRTHTGEKPYKCSVCDHACTQSSKLKRHMKTHRRSNRGNGLAGGERGTANGADTSSTPDLTSNEDDEDDSEMDDDDDAEIEEEEEEEDDDDDEDADGDDDDEEEEDEEEEDMELEDEDNDENEGGDVPEDLTTKSTSSAEHDKKPRGGGGGGGGGGSSHTSPDNTPGDRPLPPSSLVGELMSKFGLSNIQQYSEAYRQALKESSSLLQPPFRVRRKDNFRLSAVITDNNNGSAKSANPLRNSENGLADKTVADLRFREELAKNLIAAGQNPLDLVGAAHHGIFGPGSAFDNPFDPAAKRLKLDAENPHHPLMTRDRMFAAGMWLPAIAAHHRGESFLSGLPGADRVNKPSGGDSGGGGGGGGRGSKPGPSALSVALNLGLQGHAKKESRRNDTCEYCGKVFKNCSNLTVHRRSHTGEKPYKCELCSYACAQSSKLTRHMKTHGRLGKDVYRCRFCEMPFSVPSTLEKHMRKCVVNQNIKLEGSQYIKMDDGSSKLSDHPSGGGSMKLDGGGYMLPSSMVDDESYGSSAMSKDNT